jgi:hypothetical protein
VHSPSLGIHDDDGAASPHLASAQSPPDNCGVLLNPHDVDDPALTAVNPSVSEINYDVPSPRSSPRRGPAAKDAIKDNSNEFCIAGEEVDDAYESDDSDDEDYRGDIYEDDYSNGEEDLLLTYRVPSARGKGAGRKATTGRPPKPDTKGMSERDASAAVTEWKKKWKRTNDANRRTAAAAAALQDVDESLDPSGDLYTGVCTRSLWEMKDVEINPLRKGDTFPNKEILMLRIAEEANLFAVRFQTRRSDLFQLQVYGAGGDPFHVHGNYRSGKGMWAVTVCVMPYWWHTSHWRKQYPQGVSVGSNFSIDMMRNGERDHKYKLCPAICGPNKTGRPKLDKRCKSLMEQAMEKKKKQNQAKEAKKQVSSKGTTTGKGKKRKQVARDGTKRVSERQRKKK